MRHAKGLKSLHEPAAVSQTFALFERSIPAAALPKRVDHTAGFEPVEDQLTFGACVAFGTGALCEYWQRKTAGRAHRVSKRALFSLARHRFAPSDTHDDGLYIYQGLRALERGYVRFEDWRYVRDGDFRKMLDIVPPNKVRADFVLGGYEAVARDVDAIRGALHERGPVAVATDWSDAWEEPGGAVLPAPTTSAGGHCLVIVGYDDERHAFHIRNSWSARWADGGYCWLPYAFATEHPAHWPTTLYTASA